jgi:type IV pilus assembly protein PilN
MVKINLLPHREAKRKQKKNAFYAMLMMSFAVGAGAVAATGGVIDHQISAQQQRNNFIQMENAKLDKQIREVASLKQEIEGLKARQKAVEDLQSDRNQPVHLMDELVKHVPEGIYLKSFKQNDQSVVLNGVAHSNERVSELLRNLSNNSPWLERPDLVEIRATTGGNNKASRRVYEFTVNVRIKRATDAKPEGTGAPANVPAAAAGFSDLTVPASRQS